MPEVRVGENLVVEEVKFDGKKIKKIVQGKELTIVIASIAPSNATFETTKKEQFWTVDSTGEKYIVKSPADTSVENGNQVKSDIRVLKLMTTKSSQNPALLSLFRKKFIK